MELDKILSTIDKLSKKEKTPVYAVGGFVRDLLLAKKEFKDIDFVVEGSGIDFANKLDDALKQEGRLIVFDDFDTARYLFIEQKEEDIKDEENQEENERVNQKKVLLELEFAGARSETYEKGSRKPIVKGTTLKEDLLRRDFTVNTLALPSGLVLKALDNVESVKDSIIDNFNGIADIEAKVLSTPLNPNETFIDDPLRMMRAVRFASQLGFSIEGKTLQAIFDNRHRMKIVSAERITEELIKILSTPKPSIALHLMFQTHLLDLILPEVSQLDGVEEIYGHQHKNNLIHTFKVVDNIATRTDKAMLRLAALLHDIGKFETKTFVKNIGWTFYQHEHVGRKLVYGISRRLRLSKKDTEYLATLVRWHQQPISLMDEGITDSAVRRLIVNLDDKLDDLLILGVSDITTGNPYKLKKRQQNYERLRTRIAEVMEKDKLRAFQSPVRGEEIMELCSLRPGPTVGKIKQDIEDAILDGKIPNEYEEAKKYFESIKDKYISKANEREILKK